MSLICFALIEIYSRLRIDPNYFYAINTLNEKTEENYKNRYKDFDTKHVDYLFIGYSRVPATINPQLIRQLSNGKTVINEGRGYMTPGIHYQALKNKLEEYPDYLKNAVVFIEYPGSQIYTSDFKQDKFLVYEPLVSTDKPMPHLLLPHLNWSSFRSFLKESNNSTSVKRELTLLYLFSSYRASQYLNDRFNAKNSVYLSKKRNNKLVSEGGIRNDIIDVAIQKAYDLASQEKKEIMEAPLLTDEIIDNSTFAKLYEIISQNGGKLMVYEMPLHSVQVDIYNTVKAKKNKIVFENWLNNHNIPIIYNPEFKYDDSDFPDIWHLSMERRDEFSTLLYKEILKQDQK